MRRYIAAALVLSLGAPAAALPSGCFSASGCEIVTGMDSPGFTDVGFSTDGFTHLWTLSLTSTDPAATVFLGGPNQFDVFTTTRTDTGFSTQTGSGFPFSFSETVRPLMTTIHFRGPRSFDFCNQAGPVGEICAVQYNAIGNATGFYALANVPTVTLRITDAVVPEPASWALMLAGFGLLGGAVRTRKLRPLSA